MDMIIANPIYDFAFKILMADNRVAKFFVSTLIGENVETLVFKPQERTVKMPEDYERIENETIRRIYKHIKTLGFAVLRYDFIATIKLKDNTHKKVLIELQKAKNPHDLLRFRHYLAEQYQTQDVVDVNGREETLNLPIISIYLLGFILPEIEAVAFRVQRTYWDLINNVPINAKSSFVEELTHDCFVVQIPRIEGKMRNTLEKLLSVFEQKNFVGDDQILKSYHHHVDQEEIREIVSTLAYVAADADQRKIIEDEKELYRLIMLEQGGFGQKYMDALKEMEEQRKELALVKKENEELRKRQINKTDTPDETQDL